MNTTPVQIINIITDPTTNNTTAIVTLSILKAEPQYLKASIGLLEGNLIYALLNNKTYSKKNAVFLFADLCEAQNLQVANIVISKHENGFFECTIQFSNNSTNLFARLSDALIVALYYKVPIQIANQILP
jgi:bifunctional DNase/RNase